MKTTTGIKIFIIAIAILIPSIIHAEPNTDFRERIRYYFIEHKDLKVHGYPFQDCFEKAAKTYNLPLPFLIAVASGESNFDPKAVSSIGCCHGIMQINWTAGTAGDLGFKHKNDLYKPCLNIMAGAKYLRQLLDRYENDAVPALAAYYYGPGKVKKRHIPAKALDYVNYITDHYESIISRAEKGQTGPVVAKVYQKDVPASQDLVIQKWNWYFRASIQKKRLRNLGLPAEVMKEGVMFKVVILIQSNEERMKFKKIIQGKTVYTVH